MGSGSAARSKGCTVDLQSGMPMMHSIYKPTPEDLAALNAGGVLRLGIMGSGHPVFQLGVLGPQVTSALGIKEMWDMGPVVDNLQEVKE